MKFLNLKYFEESERHRNLISSDFRPELKESFISIAIGSIEAVTGLKYIEGKGYFEIRTASTTYYVTSQYYVDLMKELHENVF